jgi:hypothetical protein
MDSLLKPERFSTLPNAKSASTDWNHWYCTFTNFLDSSSQSKSSKCNSLHCLINCLSPTVYNYIAECSSYESAIKVLRNLYEKKSNPIVARYSLISRKQTPNESIDEYLTSLQLLAKDCDYYAVDYE